MARRLLFIGRVDVGRLVCWVVGSRLVGVVGLGGSY